MNNKIYLIISIFLISLIVFFFIVIKLPTSIGFFVINLFFLIQISKFRQKIAKYFYLLFINILSLSLLLSLLSIGLNLFSYFRNFKKLKVIDRSKHIEFIYGTKEPLGFRYKSNKTGINKKVLDNKYLGKRKVVIDTKYTIDERGNRKLPFSDDIDYSNSILFLGGSLTFGEALNDNQTLPYYVSKNLKINTINAGMNGYGPHQALHFLENDEIYNKRIATGKVQFVIYRALIQHINRAAGYALWDYYGPCYKIASNTKKLEYKGSFSQCNKLSIIKRIEIKLLNLIKSQYEPWTSDLINMFEFRKYNNQKYLTDDSKRFLKIIEKMDLISKSRGAKFVMIIENVNTNPKSCLLDEPYSKELIAELSKKSIPFILTSEIYKNQKCENLQVKYDAHPSAYANKLLAEEISIYIKKHYKLNLQ